MCTINIFSGVIVPGGFGTRGIEGKVAACTWCRTNDKPFLGICLGLQVAVIEFSRNILGLEGANSTEINPDTPHRVIIDMPEHTQGQKGGTMRLGKRYTRFKDDSVISELIKFIDRKLWTRMSVFWKSGFLSIPSTIYLYFLERLYGNVDGIQERHRHRYEVNPEFVGSLEGAGLRFVGENSLLSISGFFVFQILVF